MQINLIECKIETIALQHVTGNTDLIHGSRHHWSSLIIENKEFCFLIQWISFDIDVTQNKSEAHLNYEHGGGK